MSLIAGNLGVVQRLFDSQQVRWAVCAGAAAHLYGTRRPIHDIDILVERGQLQRVVNVLHMQQKAVQFDGRRVMWRGIKVFDDLSISRAGVMHPYPFDAAMTAHLRRIPLLGTQVVVLSPEDVVAHKVVAGRGREAGKCDLDDALGIIQRQTLDGDYLLQRLQSMQAETHAATVLAQLGISPVSWQTAVPSLQ